MMRLFTGLSLPPVLSARLQLMQGGIPGARWTAAGNHHLTLTFIGEVDEATAEEADAALAALDLPSFGLSLTGAGLFSQGSRPQVLWLGVAQNDALMRLKEKIDHALMKARVPFEARKYTPHVTLARLKNPDEEKLAAFLSAHAGFTAPAFDVAHFLLYESRSTADGPVYDPLRAYPLG